MILSEFEIFFVTLLDFEFWIMKVLKFGGTSVGTVDSLRNVKKIVESLTEPAVVVVSALGGITDKLILTARKAAASDDSYRDDMKAIRMRHINVIDGVISEIYRQKCLSYISPLIDELERIYDGVRLIGDLPPRTLDQIMSFGERISSIIVNHMIPSSRHVDSLSIVKTEKWFDKNIAETKLTDANIKNRIFPEAGSPVIAGGFISTDSRTGDITNLGRGGSDYTAALIAAAFDADVLEIWTDVDGFMTSDPRIIPEASVIPIMSFVESMELCSFGAKVIYPPTIYPVFHKNIPIKILNTFNPDAPGTLIKDFHHKDLAGSGRIRGLSALKNTAIINIRGSLAQNVAAISSRTFNALAQKGVSVFLVSPTEDNECFSFALKNTDIDNAKSIIETEFAPEFSSGLINAVESLGGLSLVAIVGEEILSGGYISPRITNTLQRASIEPVAFSEGASRTTVTFAVSEDNTETTLRLIHSLFF